MQAVAPNSLLPSEKFQGKGYIEDGKMVRALSELALRVVALRSAGWCCGIQYRCVQYKEMYDKSISDPEGFWGEIAEEFTWKDKVCLRFWNFFHVPPNHSSAVCITQGY